MPNDSYSQQALAADLTFQTRVRSCLANVAWQVLQEDPATPYHDVRWNYANQTIKNLIGATPPICYWLVERPNLLAFATAYSFPASAVVTAAGVPSIPPRKGMSAPTVDDYTRDPRCRAGRPRPGVRQTSDMQTPGGIPGRL